jgi:hypothetical protein
MAWAALFGTVSFELFGQLHGIVGEQPGDREAFFAASVHRWGGASQHRPGRTGPGARKPRQLLEPKYAPLLIPAIMAIAMSFVMSLVQTIARLGFTPNLVSAWLTSFAIGVAVAIPTAILVASGAQRLVSGLTGAPRRSPPDKHR